MESNPYDALKAKKQSTQFGLFALFVVMTVAAVACAVTRLPIPWIAKFGPLWALLIFLIGWAVRNRKYPDPRLPKVR
jgi:low affinity Fe/Cu permease